MRTLALVVAVFFAAMAFAGDPYDPTWSPPVNIPDPGFEDLYTALRLGNFQAARLHLDRVSEENRRQTKFMIAAHDVAFITGDLSVLETFPKDQPIYAYVLSWRRMVLGLCGPQETDFAVKSAAHELQRWSPTALPQSPPEAIVSVGIADNERIYGSLPIAAHYANKARQSNPDMVLVWIVSAEIERERFRFGAEHMFLTRAYGLARGEERNTIQRWMAQAYRMSVHFPTPESYIARTRTPSSARPKPAPPGRISSCQ